MKKVMVIDDDKAILDLLGTVLSDAGFRPILLSRSEGVPEKVAAEKPDLILLDILMEPQHGMEVLASLSQTEPRPPVILISAAVKGLPEMGNIARALGCYDFLEKPFDINELLKKVHQALEEAGSAGGKRLEE